MRVEANSVKKRFGRIDALRGLDFAIPSGQRVGLIGPNASGKSTLIRIVLGLLRHEGTLLLDGATKRDVHLAEKITYVPQIAPKFSATVGDVVSAITRVRGLSPTEVAICGQELGIDVARLSKQSFQSLSGGAKQKTLISLALATRGSLVVLDEPTASLDTGSRGRFFRLLQERTEDATMILCSHRLEEIRSLVDHVMVLEEGSLKYYGPTEDYLDDITLSTIEVQVAGDRHSGLLLSLGFEEGISGWWRRTTTRPEKLRLFESLPKSLQGDLVNLLVRDAEAVQLDAEPLKGAAQ